MYKMTTFAEFNKFVHTDTATSNLVDTFYQLMGMSLEEYNLPDNVLEELIANPIAQVGSTQEVVQACARSLDVLLVSIYILKYLVEATQAFRRQYKAVDDDIANIVSRVVRNSDGDFIMNFIDGMIGEQ